MKELNQLLSASMSALLEDQEAHDAIVAYIKALTDKEKPHEQWREVWWEQSADVRQAREALILILHYHTQK